MMMMAVPMMATPRVCRDRADAQKYRQHHDDARMYAPILYAKTEVTHRRYVLLLTLRACRKVDTRLVCTQRQGRCQHLRSPPSASEKTHTAPRATDIPLHYEPPAARGRRGSRGSHRWCWPSSAEMLRISPMPLSANQAGGVQQHAMPAPAEAARISREKNARASGDLSIIVRSAIARPDIKPILRHSQRP
jgi:hypothetical protein